MQQLAGAEGAGLYCIICGKAGQHLPRQRAPLGSFCFVHILGCFQQAAGHDGRRGGIPGFAAFRGKEHIPAGDHILRQAGKVKRQRFAEHIQKLFIVGVGVANGAAVHAPRLSPVLGVVRLDEERSFVLADIPGLIEGAHEGVGLGHDFLRHVERTKVLLHIVDVAGVDGRDPIEDFDKINTELAEYSERLARRKQLVVANKMDLPEAQENFERLKEYVEAKGYEICKASAATGEGLRELMFKAYDMLLQYVPEEDEEDLARFDEIDPDSYEIVVGNDTDWEVRGKNIERLVAMTNFDNDEALYRFQLIWKRLGIDEALKERGVQEGQSVRIRDMVFDYKD